MIEINVVQLTPCSMDRELFIRMAKDYIFTLQEFDGSIRWDEETWKQAVWRSQFIMEDRTVQGFAVTEIVPFNVFADAMYITEFYIVPEARRRRLGTDAVRAILENWDGDVFLYILNKNKVAKIFWSNVEAELGWRRIERPEIKQESGCELRIYQKEIRK